ncbi:MAG: hypothetical protein AAF570_24065, partial [Bacteroidota bacterium]
PGNPGWYEQWHTMRANENGVVPRHYLDAAREQAIARHKTAAPNLLSVTELGPANVGGRTRALIFDVLDHDRILAGAISGGIWESTDRGQSWAPINDFAPTLSVTSMDQDRQLPLEIYYTTGEVRGNSAGIDGDGVYKSVDGGQTFSKLASTNGSDFESTWRVVCSPNRASEVYVATQEGGLYRSQDGGTTWEQVFGSSGAWEVSDVEVFADSSVMIGVRTRGIYISPSGDQGTFTLVSDPEVPSTGLRRVELAVCDSFPDNVYAVFETSQGNGVTGMYRTTDRGLTWAETNDNPDFTIGYAFPWYCLLLSVKPDDPNMIITGGAQLGYSSNGGGTWNSAGNTHADYHIATYDPDDATKVFIGNDGGIYEYTTSVMSSAGLDLNDGYNVTQFYAGTYYPGDDIIGGTQDNGTQTSRNLSDAFDHVYGGDGAYCAVNQQNPSVSFVSFQRGNIARATNSLSTFPNYTNIK